MWSATVAPAESLTCIYMRYTQDSTFVGAIGAYDRAGSVFKLKPSKGVQLLSESDLKQLIHPELISEFRDSYLGNH